MEDEVIRFTFLDPVDGYIELVLEDIGEVTSQGWNIEPHKEPLRVRYYPPYTLSDSVSIV